ncbi:helix-turn-helix domain-containing protein [Amycolatopsis alkalitolerans]|uniref:Helix-turn-helix domain-containing protein n=1 Tax=Amycolatopsis alkalitolerans TaxID=2547244 RepID=A0A5C4M304_9PSEU|nr:helix-turn-helix transcriptional regulator [Amycolatopsis alkalitolerans]TNC26117.1 helix-turn-helix domain-containing protein [Amycolatopsis alkalitolerans]
MAQASPPDVEQAAGPTARRMILGTQLRRLREAAGITRAQAAWEIRASESKISRMELGRVGCKERDVVDLLTMYGVHDETERTWAVEMVKQANRPGWWRSFNDTLPTWFDNYIGLEEAATRIRTYELMFVPGLLQTEDYARAVISRGAQDTSDPEVEARVAIRMRRQRLLGGPKPPRLWAVLDQAVLGRPVGGHGVLKKQLEYLVEMIAMPNISLQIVPFETSGFAAESAFSLLQFAEPELPNIAYIEHLNGALYLEKLDELELYSRAFDRLTVDAETPDRSRQRLVKRIAEI